MLLKDAPKEISQPSQIQDSHFVDAGSSEISSHGKNGDLLASEFGRPGIFETLVSGSRPCSKFHSRRSSKAPLDSPSDTSDRKIKRLSGQRSMTSSTKTCTVCRTRKRCFLQICARSITNPNSTSNAIALQSPPGCGKDPRRPGIRESPGKTVSSGGSGWCKRFQSPHRTRLYLPEF